MAEVGDRHDTVASEGSDISVGNMSDFNESDDEMGQNWDDEIPNVDLNNNFRDFAGIFESDSENDDSDFEGFDADWKRDGFTAQNRRDFTGNRVIYALFPDDTRALQYFLAIWNDEMWNHLVEETNRYAEEERTPNPPPPNAPKWKPVDRNKMKASIGLCFVMGVIRLPYRTDYWRVSKRLMKTCFNDIIPRDEFNLIWRYLHLYNRQAPRPDVPNKLEQE